MQGSRVHLFGVAYKPNVGDTRESPALDIAELLLKRGAVVTYSDPFVPAVREGRLSLEAVSSEQALTDGIDAAVIIADHHDFDYAAIVRSAPVVVDTRNVLRDMNADNIFGL